MKAITKLLFVALLIGVALSLPTKVRAGGTTYTCDWQYFGQCVGQLQQWLEQCTPGLLRVQRQRARSVLRDNNRL